MSLMAVLHNKFSKNLITLYETKLNYAFVTRNTYYSLSLSTRGSSFISDANIKRKSYEKKGQ